MIVSSSPKTAPRLGLSQAMAISGGSPFVPKIKGWVQGTTRQLPDCPRCGASTVANVANGRRELPAVRFDEARQDYVCDACGLDHGIGKGPITKQVAQHNLITRDFWHVLLRWYNNFYNVSAMYVLISNDDTGVHELKGIAECTLNGTKNSGSITATKNTTLNYYEYQYVFGNPGANRTIRQVGLAKYEGYHPIGNLAVQIVSSMTELTSPILQTPSETFEVVYRYQFTQVTP